MTFDDIKNLLISKLIFTPCEIKNEISNKTIITKYTKKIKINDNKLLEIIFQDFFNLEDNSINKKAEFFYFIDNKEKLWVQKWDLIKETIYPIWKISIEGRLRHNRSDNFYLIPSKKDIDMINYFLIQYNTNVTEINSLSYIIELNNNNKIQIVSNNLNVDNHVISRDNDILSLLINTLKNKSLININPSVKNSNIKLSFYKYFTY